VDAREQALPHQLGERAHQPLQLVEGGGHQAGHHGGGAVPTVGAHDSLGRRTGMRIVKAHPAAAVIVGVDETGRQHIGRKVDIRTAGRLTVADAHDPTIAHLHPAWRELAVGQDHRARSDEQGSLGAGPGVPRQRRVVEVHRYGWRT
jgi:hypothetical protein